MISYMRSWQQWQSQIGWIFKSKANDTYCLYDSGPMVHLNYGFHTFPNQQIREHMEAIGPNTVYRQPKSFRMGGGAILR